MSGPIAVPLLLFQADESVTLRYGLDPKQVDAYWVAVARTLRSVFHEEHAEFLSARLRERVEQTSFETQIHFFHASPLQVASDLVDAPAVDLTDEQLSIYSEIVRAPDPAVEFGAS